MDSNDVRASKKYGFVEGEELISEMRPHFVSVLLQIVIVVISSAVAIPSILFLNSMMGGGSAFLWIAFGVFLAGLALVTGKKIVWWLTTRYVFTTNRIITRTGLLRIKGETIPLNRVQSIQFEKTFLDRILGGGELLIDSAAESDIVIKYVKHAEEIQRDIYAQISERESKSNSNHNNHHEGM